MARYHRDITKITWANHPRNKKTMPVKCSCGNQYATVEDREICEIAGHIQPPTGKGVD